MLIAAPCVDKVPIEGVQLLLRAVGDEEIAAQPVLQLPSAVGTGKDVEDVVKTRAILFMIPGLEGMGSILEPLARNLKYQTLCLQLGYSNLGSTAQDMAQALLPVQHTGSQYHLFMTPFVICMPYQGIPCYYRTLTFIHQQAVTVGL
jgi:hypothetical protein